MKEKLRRGIQSQNVLKLKIMSPAGLAEKCISLRHCDKSVKPLMYFPHLT